MNACASDLAIGWSAGLRNDTAHNMDIKPQICNWSFSDMSVAGTLDGPEL